jgi:ABC-type transport system involved in multi-copper enzyme maturation permease subunit
VTVLPIIDRELRMLARARWTFWVRLGVGSIGATICVVQFLSAAPGLSSDTIGSHVFNTLVISAFLLGAASCLVTADVISGENRAGTLKLLLLTRISSLDIILGKLASVGITSCCALAAFLPVLMIPVLAGGVTGGEAFRTTLALANLLFLGLAAGLFASAGTARRAIAFRGALVTMLSLIIGPALLAFSGVDFLFLFSPLATIQAASETSFVTSPASFMASLLLVHFMGWGLLQLAAARLRSSRVKEPKLTETCHSGRGSEPNFFVLGLPWDGTTNDSRPIEWVVTRQNRVRAAVWFVAVLALAFHNWISLGRTVGSNSGIAPGWAMSWPLYLASGLLGGAVVAWVASRFFLEARRTGELELLLPTPLGATNLIPEQSRMLSRLFPLPVLVLQVPLLPWVISHGLEDHNGQGLPILLMLVNSYAGVLALCWAGLAAGATARHQASAIIRTALWVTLPPFAVAAFSWTLLGTTQTDGLLAFLELFILCFYAAVIASAKKELNQPLLPLRHATPAGD